MIQLSVRRGVLSLAVLWAAVLCGRADGATVLLSGESVPTEQGWATFTQSAGAATVSNDGAFTTISTLGTTAAGARTGGILLYSKGVSLSSLATYRIELNLQVLAGTQPHNTLDASIAFGISSAGNIGGTALRSQMLYFDPNAIGWGDDTGSFAFNTTDAVHQYALEVVTATGAATLYVDGTPRLTRSGFVTADQIAFGDQTNDPNVEGAFRVGTITVVPEPASFAAVALGGLLLRRRR